jgi:hypothetical protein
MTLYTNEYLRSLVRDDRVHRSFYTDPQIFEMEMENFQPGLDLRRTREPSTQSG